MVFIDRLYPLVQQLLWVHVSTLHFFLYLSLDVFPATEAANVLRPGNGPKLLKIVSCHSVIMVFIDRLYPLVQHLWAVATLRFFVNFDPEYSFPSSPSLKKFEGGVAPQPLGVAPLNPA